MKRINFPRDELAHKCTTEWWYFNGNLKDKNNNKYAFMNCLFKVDVKKVNAPLLRPPFRIAYFSHSLLSDIKNKKNYPDVNYISIISKDSFSKDDLFINYTDPLKGFKRYINCVIEKTGKSDYYLKTGNLDLRMKSMKKPLLEGGTGYVKLGAGGTYYYSLTNLKTEGTIKIGNEWIKVKGKSWMDHQWMNTGYSKDKWVWFSIQLDNDIELVCFEHMNKNRKSRLATISYPNNKQISTSEVKFTHTGDIWQSPKTNTVYPLSWIVDIPSQKIKIKIKPLLKKQEMLFGTINYWEGPLAIEAVVKGKKVKGVGFAELVGFPMKLLDLKNYKKNFEKEISRKINAYLRARDETLNNSWSARLTRNIYEKMFKRR